MKNYKVFLIVLSAIILAALAIINYVDMPAPSKIEKKVLDVNDESVK